MSTSNGSRHPVDVLGDIRARFEPLRQLGNIAWERLDPRNNPGTLGTDVEFNSELARALLVFGDDLDDAFVATKGWCEKAGSK